MIATIDYDDEHDVLYVSTEGISSWRGRESAHDTFFILRTENDQVVGVTVIGAGELSQHDWIEHPERSQLPKPLRIAIDDWYAAKQKRESK